MADFTLNSYFQLLGPDEDPSGGPQIALARPIGGGESLTGDGLDEQLALVDNMHTCWAGANRRALIAFTPWGKVSPQASLNGTDAAYTKRMEVPCRLSTGRTSIKVYYDYTDAHLKVGMYNSASDALIAEFEVNSATRTQGSQTLSGAAVEPIYLRVELKKHTTEYKLYSLLAVEEVPALTTFASRIDRDAIADDQPLDTWLLQRQADGLAEIEGDRLRGCSIPFDYADPLVISSFFTRAVCLGSWQLTPRATDLTVVLRQKTQYADMNVEAAVLRERGLSSEDPDTAVTATGSVAQTTLTLDVRAHRGRRVDLFVVFRSEEDGATTVLNPDETVQQIRENMVDFDTGHGSYAALTASTRYSVRFGDLSGATAEEDFPSPRMIIWDDAGKWYVHPPFSLNEINVNNGPEWIDNSYHLEATRLGQMVIYGVNVYESDYDARPSLKPAVRAGRSPSVFPLGDIYNRGWGTWRDNTRVLTMGGVPDPELVDGSRTVLQNASSVSYTAAGFQVAASAMVGTYDTTKALDGTNQVRSTIIVSALGLVAGKVEEEERLRLYFKATLHGWGGAAWDANEVEVESPISLTVGALNTYGRGDGRLWWFRRRGMSGDQAYHYLRGTHSASEFDREGGRVWSVEFEVEDDQTAATQRLLRFYVKGALYTERGSWISSDAARISILSFTARLREGMS